MSKGKMILEGGADVIKLVVAVVASAAVAEVGYLGGRMVEEDAETAVKAGKHAVDPEPVLAKKKGMFAKKEVVTINPVTGKVSNYKGNKKPTNKKPVRI